VSFSIPTFVQSVRRSDTNVGIGTLALGLLWPLLTRLGLGRLPGDIVIQRGNFWFYFPLATCIVVSVLLSVVFWLVNR
jgi:hypothetical protein